VKLRGITRAEQRMNAATVQRPADAHLLFRLSFWSETHRAIIDENGITPRKGHPAIRTIGASSRKVRTMSEPKTYSGGADVDAEELCERLGVGRDGLLSALRDLEFSGFIVNMTPDLPPLKSSWRITCHPCQGQPPTRDYERPDVIARIEQRQSERKAAYWRNRDVR
jgi:hypothetical protein